MGMKLQHFSPYLSVSLPAHLADFVTTCEATLDTLLHKWGLNACLMYQATHLVVVVMQPLRLGSIVSSNVLKTAISCTTYIIMELFI